MTEKNVNQLAPFYNGWILSVYLFQSMFQTFYITTVKQIFNRQVFAIYPNLAYFVREIKNSRIKIIGKRKISENKYRQKLVFKVDFN